MNDYIKAALYTVLVFGGIFGVVMFLGTFPEISMYILGVASLVCLFNLILMAIRSQRRIDEMKSRLGQ